MASDRVGDKIRKLKSGARQFLGAEDWLEWERCTAGVVACADPSEYGFELDVFFGPSTLDQHVEPLTGETPLVHIEVQALKAEL